MSPRHLLPLALLLILATSSAARDTRPTVAQSTAELAEQELISSKGSFDNWESIIYLYGGPGTLEGKFELANGLPDPQGWQGVDETDLPDDWQHSTFNAENLADRGPGNHAMWIGRTAEQEPGWVDAPGYGNNWNARLVWRSGPLSDPEVGQTVELDFYFNYEMEPNYDYLYVEYEKAGQWIVLLARDQTNSVEGVFSPPGALYSDQGMNPVYDGGDYGGENGDEIVIRLRFRSDGAFSDEAGLWPTTAGAAQADEFLVQWADGGAPQSSFEDFEGSGPYAWVNEPTTPVGDFAKVRAGMGRDLPCQQPYPGAWVFFDDGTPPSNGNGLSTGGETSEVYDYGTPEGYVVNHSGGLSGDNSPVKNGIQSPPIPLDLPGLEDDDPTLGLFARYLGYEHTTHFQPESFLYWRFSIDGGTSWKAWHNNVYLFYAPGPPQNFDRTVELTGDIPNGATHVQLFVRRIDVEELEPSLTFEDRTPSPYIDEVELFKAHAPVNVWIWDELLDAFPRTAGLDVSSAVARDALDVPLNPTDDGALRVEVNEPDGVDLVPIEDLLLHWVLDANPLFENGLRNYPPGTILQPGAGRFGGGVFTGSFTASSRGGSSVYFDLPDEDFLYPGDLFRWHLQVTDSRGFVTHYPADISGFNNGEGYDPRYVVRGLPTLVDAEGTHPSMLIYVRDLDPGLATQSLSQLGFSDGVDYDIFRQPGNFTEYEDHIGRASWRGADLEQLDGYTTILEFGRGSAENVPDESVFLAAWHALSGARSYLIFDEDIVQRVGYSSPGPLGAEVLGLDTSEWLFDGVYPLIEDDRAPFSVPQLAGYEAMPVAYYTCKRRGIDYLRPAAGAVRGHVFAPAGQPGSPYATDAAASVYYETDAGDGRKLGVSFPFNFDDLMDLQTKAGVISERTLLLQELLADVGATGGSPPTGGSPASRTGIHGLSNHPNPFNPSTEIRFELGRSGPCRVSIYDLRGQLVRVLHEEFTEAGTRSVMWNGQDAAGANVASGVYFVRVQANGTSQTIKVGLLK